MWWRNGWSLTIGHGNLIRINGPQRLYFIYLKNMNNLLSFRRCYLEINIGTRTYGTPQYFIFADVITSVKSFQSDASSTAVTFGLWSHY